MDLFVDLPGKLEGDGSWMSLIWMWTILKSAAAAQKRKHADVQLMILTP